MTEPHRIAVGVDFAPESDLAARQALDLARRDGSEVVLVHVIPTLDLPPMRGDGPASATRALSAYRAYLKEQRASDDRRLADLTEQLSDQGVAVSHVLSEGFPDSGLCEAAGALGASLTVVGTHGRTGLRWFLLGSVAQRVIQLASSDVLVARGEGAARGGYGRVLVATDFSPGSARALALARTLAAEDGQIDVVHFYHHLPPPALYGSIHSVLGAEFNESLLAEIRAAGQAFIGAPPTTGASAAGADADTGERQPGAGPVVRFYAVSETPIPGIVHWLERQRYDLAAVGTHGRRGVRHLMVGSVAEAVARRAPCSVLVARSHPETA